MNEYLQTARKILEACDPETTAEVCLKKALEEVLKLLEKQHAPQLPANVRIR